MQIVETEAQWEEASPAQTTQLLGGQAVEETEDARLDQKGEARKSPGVL